MHATRTVVARSLVACGSRVTNAAAAASQATASANLAFLSASSLKPALASASITPLSSRTSHACRLFSSPAQPPPTSSPFSNPTPTGQTASGFPSAASSDSTPKQQQPQQQPGEEEEPMNPEDYARLRAQRGEVDEDEGQDESGGWDHSSSRSDRRRAQSIRSERERLLDASLAHVHEHGWTSAALRRGASALGLHSDSSVLQTTQPVELVWRLQRRAQEEMKSKLGKMQLDQMSTSEKLEAAIRARLESLLPYISIWPQALALATQPQNAPTTLCNTTQAIDEIWHIAGDQSTDFHWYTKRALLLGVCSSTELFLLTDRSARYEATWSFLRRRLRDAAKVATWPAHAQSGVSAVINAAGSFLARSMHASDRR